MKIFISLFSLLLFFFPASAQEEKAAMPVNIRWTSAVSGNFSFVKKWSYPEGVEMNQFGQLSCDGFCPEAAQAMIDGTGKIITDSLTSFYKVVDTSHQYYSIQCNAWCYEWAGTDFIEAVKKSADTVYCYTLMNAATHSSLQLIIAGDKCFALIDLRSVVEGGNAKHNCSSGFITIDKNLWKKGIMKAAFKFNFENSANPKKPFYWKGKIFTKIVSVK